jgi:hypothetical protein
MAMGIPWSLSSHTEPLFEAPQTHQSIHRTLKDKHKIWPAAHEKYYGPSRRAEGDERMSYVEKAHRGLEMFQFLYKIEDNLQGYAGPQRVLNQELLGRSADAPRIVSSFKEGDLTIQILSCHSFGNRQHLAGRTIWYSFRVFG